jgi:hypothetical protein
MTVNETGTAAGATNDTILERVRTDLYLNGLWRPSSDGTRIDVQDPSTEETIASVATRFVRGATPPHANERRFCARHSKS